MESNRAGYRLSRMRPRGHQAGITVIGVLFLVVVFGAIGMAVLRIVPLYMTRMKIGTVLEDIQQELGTGSNTVAGIRNALDSRFYIEAVEVDQDEIEVTRTGDGFAVRVEKELRAPFFADLWFLVLLDEQIQLPR